MSTVFHENGHLKNEKNGKKIRNVQAKQKIACNLLISVENLQACDLSVLCAVMSASHTADDRFRATGEYGSLLLFLFKGQAVSLRRKKPPCEQDDSR